MQYVGVSQTSTTEDGHEGRTRNIFVQDWSRVVLISSVPTVVRHFVNEVDCPRAFEIAAGLPAIGAGGRRRCIVGNGNACAGRPTRRGPSVSAARCPPSGAGAETEDAARAISGSPAALHLRVLPLVRDQAVPSLERGRPPAAARPRVELHADARRLRLGVHGGDGAARAVDQGRRRRRDQRELVGAGQRRRSPDPVADGRDGGARHQGDVSPRAVPRSSRARLRRRHRISDPQYGDARRWDAFLLLRHEDGATGPVFKSFRTILPRDRHRLPRRGRPAVGDFADDAAWREQTDRVRATFARAASTHVTLLADSLDVGRTDAAGFDGIAIYDNYVRPDTLARRTPKPAPRAICSSRSTSTRASTASSIAARRPAPATCRRCSSRRRRRTTGRGRRSGDRAARASERRIIESFDATLALQTDPALSNARRGFFLVYLNSFNEWHEGHQFEPMRDCGRPDAGGARRRLPQSGRRSAPDETAEAVARRCAVTGAGGAGTAVRAGRSRERGYQGQKRPRPCLPASA